MKRPHHRLAPRLSLPGAALLVMGGCASTPPPTDWNRVTLRDRHHHMPAQTPDELRPLAVIRAGPGGQLLGTGDAAPPGVALVVQDGQARLVSQETMARMRDSSQPAGAMGANPAPPPATPGPAAVPASR